MMKSYINKETGKFWFQVVCIILVLYTFLVSIGLLSSAFKLFGKDLAHQLIAMTSNPLIGLFTGILATTLAQSSSTTTSIAVGLVASGALTIEGAIPVVMGANIGTSVTNTLVSMGHITRKEEFRRALAGATVHDFFNLIAVLILLPLELLFGGLQWLAITAGTYFADIGGMKAASPIKLITAPTINFLLDLFNKNAVISLITALVLMYIALKFLVDLAKGIVIQRAERYLNRYLFGSPFIALIFGMLVTIMVQSSSITTSMVIPLIGAGILTLEQIFPYTLGANIGTTTTAMLASLATGNIHAVIVAFSHLFFNLMGIILIYPIKIIRRIPIQLAQNLAILTSRSRGYAFLYIALVFYLIPLSLIFLWR